MLIIGRQKEQQLLADCLRSPRPEFLAVYGRRRVGKTYLIRQYFNDRFSFYATGEFSERMKNQLKLFHEQLRNTVILRERFPKTGWKHFPVCVVFWSSRMYTVILLESGLFFWMKFRGWIPHGLIFAVPWTTFGTAGDLPNPI